MTQDDVIRTSPPICALDFGVPAEFAERAESYARWAVAQEREKRTGTQEFVTLPREVVKQALEALFMYKPMVTGVTFQHGLEAMQALRAALNQPQGDQPAMTPIAQRKLDSLLTEGYTISGYSIYHERKHQHGFVTGAGLVGWWRPEGVEYPQPQGEQEPVAWLKTWDSVGHARTGMKRVDLTPECETWLANMFPVITPLYTHPQPKRNPLTDEQIDAIADAMPGGLEGFMKGWGWRQFARAVIEATNNIK